MEHNIRLSDLRDLSPGARESALADLVSVARAPVNGQAVALQARIASFERRYEMTSDEFVQRFERHELEETADYANWLFWIRLREVGVAR
jgi:hypothetical protein